jgi:hypothetical protein
MAYDTHPSTGPQAVKAILKRSSTTGDGTTSLYASNGVIAIMIINRSRNITLPPATFKHRINKTATCVTYVVEVYG